ncbi:MULTISPECIES: rnhA operon protein [Halorussus]|uniref:DUF7108 family protein n=1 Tax=Halorussus TaxID=1070314 RepID=UPI000E211F42|nr:MULTISPECIES: rnhA operon protein [Halorussus]NHN58066.1 rnhA operon protein [Halorussus sp. JP-T4]
MPDPDSATDSDSSDDGETTPSSEDDTLPEEVVERAERLTHRARDAVDDAEADAYREERGDLLAEHDYLARVREDDTGATLVLHPDEWVERVAPEEQRGEGGETAEVRIRTDRIEDTGRAVEVSLSGPGDPDEWETVEEHNREIAARVREAHGDVHGDNAAAFADFMGNHYARPVESATSGEIEEFLAEYFPRNAWPTEEQRAAVEESIDLVFEAVDE